MRIEHDAFCFELRIVGYQFPELAEAQDDSNWLNVKIVVNHPKGDWSAVDPALLTYEVSRLAGWLRAVGKGQLETREMGFIEPCLTFKVYSGGTADELKIELAHEFRPPWMKDIDHSAKLSFHISEIDLSVAADSLDRQLAKYPRRGNR